LLPIPAAQPGGANANAYHVNNPFLQAVQNVNTLAAAAGMHVPGLPQVPNSNNNWLSPRTGSWPYLLSAISPGITLAAAGSTTCPVNIPSIVSNHKLTTLEIRSAGYCRLGLPRLDESAIPVPTTGGASAWFSKRYQALSKVMFSSKAGGSMADIVQALPCVESQALVNGFEMEIGWPKEWAEEVDAPTFDGQLPGGTGRFCGILDIESRVEAVEED
jgi:hypothetical protein